jgi:hypothetical protein
MKFVLFIASNFSHRIDDFSFGENSNLVHNALNFDLKTTNSGLIFMKMYVQLIVRLCTFTFFS